MQCRWVIATLLAALVPMAGCGAGSPSSGGSSPAADPPSVTAPISSTPATGRDQPIPAPAKVTLANSNSTIAMKVGQTFTLALGDQNWNVQVADQSILARLPNFMMVRGAQGIYKAYKPGTTTLSATGTAACGAGQACPMYVILFKLTVEVTAS